jgi:hypothetical protein
MNIHDAFIEAIHNKRFVSIIADTYEKGIIERKCIPFDFGPSSRIKDGQNRYHFWDLNSPDGPHNLPLLPVQLLKLKILEEHFDPKDYVYWKPNWHIQRDWGEYS